MNTALLKKIDSLVVEGIKSAMSFPPPPPPPRPTRMASFLAVPTPVASSSSVSVPVVSTTTDVASSTSPPPEIVSDRVLVPTEPVAAASSFPPPPPPVESAPATFTPTQQPVPVESNPKPVPVADATPAPPIIVGSNDSLKVELPKTHASTDDFQPFVSANSVLFTTSSTTGPTRKPGDEEHKYPSLIDPLAAVPLRRYPLLGVVGPTGVTGPVGEIGRGPIGDEGSVGSTTTFTKSERKENEAEKPLVVTQTVKTNPSGEGITLRAALYQIVEQFKLVLAHTVKCTQPEKCVELVCARFVEYQRFVLDPNSTHRLCIGVSSTLASCPVCAVVISKHVDLPPETITATPSFATTTTTVVTKKPTPSPVKKPAATTARTLTPSKQQQQQQQQQQQSGNKNTEVRVIRAPATATTSSIVKLAPTTTAAKTSTVAKKTKS